MAQACNLDGRGGPPPQYETAAQNQQPNHHHTERESLLPQTRYVLAEPMHISPKQSDHTKYILSLMALVIGICIGSSVTSRNYAMKEHDRREQEERNRIDHMVWRGLEASPQCLRYGTREYTATLFNVPLIGDPLTECAKKSIEIHGKHIFPSYCESQGVCGLVTGHWTVDFNEALCTPWWGWITDKGCDQGRHRYEGPLHNLQNDDNWKGICETTPAVIKGVRYDGPTSCADWGRQGKWGIWFIDDCR